MDKLQFNSEDQFALSVTGGVHLVLLLIFIFYTFSIEANVRPSFIEVEFGEFKSGKPADYAKEKAEEVATQPDPSETEPEEPEPEKPDPVEEKKATTDKTTKQVDLADQKKEVKEEEVKTPETDKVDPKKENSSEEQEKVFVPKADKDETQKKGAEDSGDKKGSTGAKDADQGTGNEKDKSAPYELKWEGDIERSPTVRPMPSNTTDEEATITIRFEVKPNGTVGRIVPLKKMNPELEDEVMSTLRDWRFSRLPSGIPQQSQWGTITFRFVLE